MPQDLTIHQSARIAIFIFTPLATGVSFLTYAWALAAALWVVVAAVAVANGGHLSRQSLRQPLRTPVA